MNDKRKKIEAFIREIIMYQICGLNEQSTWEQLTNHDYRNDDPHLWVQAMENVKEELLGSPTYFAKLDRLMRSS